VKTDYAKAMSWFDKAAAQGNSDAENQLGWMYEYGQGMEPDDVKAWTWYRLAADQGNIHGIRNLQALTFELKDRGQEVWQSTDAAIAQAQRWANIQDLHRRINEVEANALYQGAVTDGLVTKGKSDGITKLFNALGSAVAVKPHFEAEKYREEAARLRDELAQIENENRSSASVPAP
jgi:TPR repeat protein